MASVLETGVFAVVALQFPLAHPAVTALVVGAISPAEIAANLEALQVHVPVELWLELKAEGLLHEDAPTRGAR